MVLSKLALKREHACGFVQKFRAILERSKKRVAGIVGHYGGAASFLQILKCVRVPKSLGGIYPANPFGGYSTYAPQPSTSSSSLTPAPTRPHAHSHTYTFTPPFPFPFLPPFPPSRRTCQLSGIRRASSSASSSATAPKQGAGAEVGVGPTATITGTAAMRREWVVTRKRWRRQACSMAWAWAWAWAWACLV